MTEFKCSNELKKLSEPHYKTGQDINENFIQKQSDFSYKTTSRNPYTISIYRRIKGQKHIEETWMVVIWHDNWQPNWDSCIPTENIDEAKQWLIDRFSRSKIIISEFDVNYMFSDLEVDNDFSKFLNKKIISLTNDLQPPYIGMESLYEEDLTDAEGDMYLMDGCYLTSDGRIIEK